MYCATSESADLRLSVADILSSMANGVPEPPATTTVSGRTTACRSVFSRYARACSCARRFRYFHPSATGARAKRSAPSTTGLVCYVRVLQRPARYLARPRLGAPDSACSRCRQLPILAFSRQEMPAFVSRAVKEDAVCDLMTRKTSALFGCWSSTDREWAGQVRTCLARLVRMMRYARAFVPLTNVRVTVGKS